MTDHILCSVDLTHEDEAAKLLTEAHKLAGFYGATLSVVTVLPDYGSSWVGSFFKEGAMHDAAEAASDALHKLVSKTLPDATGVQHIVEIGVVYEKVLEAIGLSKADLVIVGAHKPDFADRFLGPNAARIARHAGISTLVLRI
ncbi:universal stress protein [Roseobacter denitrificans]|uniref:Universal stress family protein, putative n=1 Tax=Roseobacter denitrificans (strain ATCC 33942 / OCh 114) TaxID=375451 RepID=Q160P2_ROSDO|nr:universal stress protein [Roseobacter denitrificans]ABG33551.1 universal stress family protein, putative [Roseobacter denitrificans OCh 114]AVL52863.1 universal stress protein [Roseobacter denitrificans]SFG04427.1 Nucleotide-binding universal stress protein, UspA family [Roseobacter denitrificans OCh 114]